jgi:hypothetical protein
MLPVIYMSRMDVEAEYLDAFVGWCRNRHWPDLISVGFHSANGYVSTVGGQLSCNVYEIPGVEVFDADYDQIRAVDEQLQIIVTQKISNHSLTVYEQVVTSGVAPHDHADRTHPNLASSFGAPAVSFLRFDAEDDDRVMAVHRDVILPQLTERDGFVAARLLRESDKHPVYPSPEPRWSLMVQWAHIQAANSHGEIAEGALTTAVPEGTARRRFNAAEHVFSLRNATTWQP